MQELKLILEASREKELRNMKFFASLKGIDLETPEAESAAQKVMDIKQRIAAERAGMSKKAADYSLLGLDVEEEEELPRRTGEND